MSVELNSKSFPVVVPTPEIESRNVKAELLESALFRFRSSGSYDSNLLRRRIIPFAPNEGFKYFCSAQKVHKLSPSFKSFYEQSLKDLVSRSSSSEEAGKILGEELEKIVEKDYRSCWQEFLPYLRHVPQLWLIRTLQVAIKKNNLEVAQVIVSLFSHLKGVREFGEMIQEASREGRCDVVKIFLNFVDTIPKDQLVWACRDAAEQGHCNVVLAFLPFADHFLNESPFDLALEGAAWGGHMDVLQVLLEHRKQFRNFQSAFAAALGNAACTGHISVIKTLFALLPEIDNPSRFSHGLWVVARQKNRSEILTLFLDNCNERILQRAFELALEIGSEEGIVDNVEVLLGCGREISPLGLKKALESAEKRLRWIRKYKKPEEEQCLQVIALLTARLEKIGSAN
jgi:hypothetical protein